MESTRTSSGCELEQRWPCWCRSYTRAAAVVVILGELTSTILCPQIHCHSLPLNTELQRTPKDTVKWNNILKAIERTAHSLTTKHWIDSIGVFVFFRFVLTRGSYLINETGQLDMILTKYDMRRIWNAHLIIAGCISKGKISFPRSRRK